MAVLTISRQFGSGGRTLGRMLAKRLNYLYLDDIIIEEIAKKAQVSKQFVKSMERTVGGNLSKFFSLMLNSEYMNRILGEEKGYIDEALYIKHLKEIITELANQDNVIVMGRGGQYILADNKNAIHVYLISDMEHKIKFMQRYYKVDVEKARRAVLQGEKKRANFFSKFGKKDYDQPHLYHLVLNKSKISQESTLDIVSDFVKLYKPDDL